jgi:hypothetical protein
MERKREEREAQGRYSFRVGPQRLEMNPVRLKLTHGSLPAAVHWTLKVESSPFNIVMTVTDDLSSTAVTVSKDS